MEGVVYTLAIWLTRVTGEDHLFLVYSFVKLFCRFIDFSMDQTHPAIWGL